MMRVEDIVRGIDQDYTHPSVQRKRREIIQTLLQTTELGCQFWREFGGTEATLLQELEQFAEIWVWKHIF